MAGRTDGGGAVKSNVAALQVNGEGRVVSANQPARERFPDCVGRTCADVVQFQDAAGETVCREGCWASIAAEAGTSDVAGQAEGAPARLVCTALQGDRGAGGGTVVLVPSLPPGPAPATPLSPREREVVRGLLRGLGVAEIAAGLGIGAATVRTHLDHVKEKLGVRKNTEVVARAIAIGLGGR